MQTIETPTQPIHIGDNPRDISAARYLKFSQACIQEVGLGTDINDLDSHLRRLGMFIGAKDPAAATAYTNLLQGINSIDAAAPLKALVLATVTLRVGETACTDLSEAGLKETAQRILDTDISQHALTEAVEAVKKNCKPNSE